jgi:hypothetical protein
LNAIFRTFACLVDVSTEEWVAGSLIRDQDLTVDARQLLIMLGRIASMDGDRDEYEDKARHDPAYLRGTQSKLKL